MNTGFLTGSMTDRYKVTPEKIYKHVILQSNMTPSFVDITEGVKYSDYVSITVDASMDSSLGFNPTSYPGGSGGVTIKDVNLTNVAITGREVYAPQDLDKKILGFLRKGTIAPDFVAEDVIIELKKAQLAQDNDKRIWQGKAEGTTEGLDKFDGIIEQLWDASTYVQSTYTALDFNTQSDSSIRTIVNDLQGKVRTSLPQLVNSELVMFMSPSQFQKTLSAFYNLSGAIDKNTITEKVTEFYLPDSGYNTKIVPVTGLLGHNGIVLTDPNNISVNVDAISEEDFMELFYSKDIRVGGAWIMDYGYKLGVTVLDPTKVVASKTLTN